MTLMFRSLVIAAPLTLAGFALAVADDDDFKHHGRFYSGQYGYYGGYHGHGAVYGAPHFVYSSYRPWHGYSSHYWHGPVAHHYDRAVPCGGYYVYRHFDDDDFDDDDFEDFYEDLYDD